MEQWTCGECSKWIMTSTPEALADAKAEHLAEHTWNPAPPPVYEESDHIIAHSLGVSLRPAVQKVNGDQCNTETS